MGGLEKKKVWTAVIVVPPLIALIAFGPSFLLSLLVLIATYFGLHEFFDLALPHSKSVQRGIGIGLGLLVSLLVTFGETAWLSLFLIVSLFVLFILFMATSHDLGSTISSIGMSLLGVIYIGFLLSHISLVRGNVHGREWVLFLISVVWASDMCAYFSGSFFGRHKIYPKISPRKTYEGLAGAIVGSILLALIFSVLFLPRVGRGLPVFFGIMIALLGQTGDFIESMLKRSVQVKDSGSLFPGHGGMLDRLDSFLFTAPFLHYSLLYLYGETP